MSNRYTQEEFEQKLHEKFPSVVITGKYLGSSKKIRFICPVCGTEHESLAQSVMKGHFCKTRIGNNNPNKKNTLDFIDELRLIDPSAVVTGEYINANTKIDFICGCGRAHNKEPAQMLRGYTKCPICSHGTVTYKMFVDELRVKRPGIQLLTIKDDDYAISKKHDRFAYICECGNESVASYDSIVNCKKCPKCPRGLSEYEYLKRVHASNPDIEVLGKFRTLDDKILFRCSCGNVDTKTARSLYEGRGRCSKCNPSKRKTTEEFISEMTAVNPRIKITGEYVNAETPIEYICECGKPHASTPSSLLMGVRCGHCNMSRSEYATSRFLDDHNITYSYEHKFDDCTYVSSLKFDFYLPAHNMCIELDGQHHFEPVRFNGISERIAIERHEYTVKLDAIKNEYCQSKQIKILRIPYWDFDKIERILEQNIQLCEQREDQANG